MNLSGDRFFHFDHYLLCYAEITILQVLFCGTNKQRLNVEETLMLVVLIIFLCSIYLAHDFDNIDAIEKVRGYIFHNFTKSI
jgi:hypothetical protein